MATKTKAWNTGGGYITLTYTGQSNGTISVSSSGNSSSESRSQTISIETTAGSPQKKISVTIKQAGKKDSLDNYTTVSYIESNGSQYIDTGVVGKSGVSIDIDTAIMVNPNDVSLVAARSGSNRFFMLHYAGGWSYGYISFYRTSATVSAYGKRYRIQSSLDAGSQTMTVDGTNVANGTVSTSVNTGYNLYVCACNKGGSAVYHSGIRIYSLKIYEKGIMVRNYIPVKRNSDGVYGLWDSVNSKFYPSNSSTNFVGA